MVYCKHEFKRRFSKERKDNKWDEKAEKFIKKGSWKYSFIDEATVSDSEQSFLSRYVFAKIMRIDTAIIPANKIYIKADNATYHFDLMNNFSDKSFEKKYKYTIGNFAPIPAKRFDYSTTAQNAHLQMIHKWNNEEWDKLLVFLKNNWPYKKSSFVDYMINTCQQLYYQEIFNDFYNECPDLEKVEWKESIELWNLKIRKNKKLSIVSFDNSVKSRKKIEFLIEARGRCILSLLGNQNTAKS